VKTITIRLPDVEAAMLAEVQKRNNRFKDIQTLFSNLIREKYCSLQKGRGKIA